MRLKFKVARTPQFTVYSEFRSSCNFKFQVHVQLVQETIKFCLFSSTLCNHTTVLDSNSSSVETKLVSYGAFKVAITTNMATLREAVADCQGICLVIARFRVQCPVGTFCCRCFLGQKLYSHCLSHPAVKRGILCNQGTAEKQLSIADVVIPVEISQKKKNICMRLKF